jgi:DNA-binding IscR family transcriptional regulator
MAQIARLLRMEGLITSKKGPGGGYVQKKKEINVLDVNNALYSTKETKLCTKDEQGQKVLSNVDNQMRLVLKDLRLL